MRCGIQHRRGHGSRGGSNARLRRGVRRGRGHARGQRRVQTPLVSENQLVLEGPWKKEESNSLIFLLEVMSLALLC